jgi:hypothetical protein
MTKGKMTTRETCVQVVLNTNQLKNKTSATMSEQNSKKVDKVKQYFSQ